MGFATSCPPALGETGRPVRPTVAATTAHANVPLPAMNGMWDDEVSFSDEEAGVLEHWLDLNA